MDTVGADVHYQQEHQLSAVGADVHDQQEHQLSTVGADVHDQQENQLSAVSADVHGQRGCLKMWMTLSWGQNFNFNSMTNSFHESGIFA